MMLSEANNGGIGIKSININSCNEKPIKATEKKKLSVEIIGDSITAAYGVEGANQYENFKTTTENFSKSYAYLTAKKLDADYSAVCYSGHGIVSGYSTGEKNAEALVPEVYTRISKNSDYPGEWDFENNQNDVIVINLGTNDLNYVKAEPETRNDEFIQEYANFLTLIRKKNPKSYIICTVGIMGGGDEIYPLIVKAVELVGDEKISSYKSNTQNMNDGLGSDWHPSLKTQTYNSYVLSDKICNAIGVESDQVGLDVAVDSVYDVVKNEENGANMSFWVGYDKSFWINTAVGGKEPTDIEAKCSGIQLKKGGVYILEFEYTSTKNGEVPVILRGVTEHFKDSIKSTSEKVTYSKEITIEENDDNAEIVYQLGGLDSFGFTLSNIKLTKIK
jgi:lysophospholipase L1-like esterase